MTRRTLMIALLLAAPACSQPKATPQPTETVEEGAGEESAKPKSSEGMIPGSAWIQLVKRTNPGQMCGPDRYVRLCYDVTLDECGATVKAATEKCLGEIEIPDQVTLTAPEPKPSLDACVCAAYHEAFGDMVNTDADACQPEAVAAVDPPNACSPPSQ